MKVDIFLEKEENLRYVTALDLIKCLKQHRLLLTCAPIYELPFNISNKIQANIMANTSSSVRSHPNPSPPSSDIPDFVAPKIYFPKNCRFCGKITEKNTLSLL